MRLHLITDIWKCQLRLHRFPSVFNLLKFEIYEFLYWNYSKWNSQKIERHEINIVFMEWFPEVEKVFVSLEICLAEHFNGSFQVFGGSITDCSYRHDGNLDHSSKEVCKYLYWYVPELLGSPQVSEVVLHLSNRPSLKSRPSTHLGVATPTMARIWAIPSTTPEAMRKPFTFPMPWNVRVLKHHKWRGRHIIYLKMLNKLVWGIVSLEPWFHAM